MCYLVKLNYTITLVNIKIFIFIFTHGRSELQKNSLLQKVTTINCKMNFLKSSSLAIFATLVTVCCGHIGGSQLLLQDVSPQVYCGRNLARVLALLCFDDISNDKRSEAGTMYNAILPPYYKDQERQAGWPWLPPHKARSMALSRNKRFVVTECCEKACSVSELLSYC